MPIPGFDRFYSQNDWRILEEAHRRASRILDRDPKYHPHANRLARAIMIFFNSGETDFGRLASMAVKRELSLSKTAGKPVDTTVVYTPLTRSERQKQLH
ncbi:hypothetical protein LJR231_003184 [Phyllobacterium sp. LjRoot231]|uniref:hypothetical protein n=1 Tax=Phyllobacterium sp. LjRoot231 TaxID=3342289 RepID=UPI003ECF8291